MTRCRICNNPLRQSVDQALLAGNSRRVVGRRFGFSESNVARHKRKCLPRLLSLATEEEAAALLLAADLLQLNREAEEAQRELKKNKDWMGVLVAIDKRRSLLEVRLRAAEVRKQFKKPNKFLFAVQFNQGGPPRVIPTAPSPATGLVLAGETQNS